MNVYMNILTPRVSGQGGEGPGRKAEIRPSNDPLTLPPPKGRPGRRAARRPRGPDPDPVQPLRRSRRPPDAGPGPTDLHTLPWGSLRWTHHFADPNEFRVIHRDFAF